MEGCNNCALLRSGTDQNISGWFCWSLGWKKRFLRSSASQIFLCMPLSWFCRSHLEIFIWDFNLLVTSLLTMLLIQEPNLIYLACYWRLKIAYLGRNWLLCHVALPWAHSLQGGRPMGSGLPASTLVLTSALSDGAFGYCSPGNWSAAFTSPKSRTVTWSWEKVHQKLTKRHLKCKKGHLYSNAFQQGRGAWGKVSLADEAHFFFFFLITTNIASIMKPRWMLKP